MEFNNYFLIGEVALSHDGSLGQAFKYIDMAADLGLNAIKFQLHIAEYESSEFEDFRSKFSIQDDTRSTYWERTGFSKSEWLKLRDYAKIKKLKFILTPFSLQAVDICAELNVDFIKVGSGDTEYIQLLEKIVI